MYVLVSLPKAFALWPRKLPPPLPASNMNSPQSRASVTRSPTPMRREAEGKTTVDERELHTYEAWPACQLAVLVLEAPGSSPAPLTRASRVVGLCTSNVAVSPPTSKMKVDAARVSYSERLP